MQRFLDVVKVNFDENIERYFRDAEIESVKKSKNNNTLNFYIISHNTIPYSYVKAAKEIMAEQLLNIDISKEEKKDVNFCNPINLVIKYKLSSSYNAKNLYEEIRKDIFDEIRDKQFACVALFRNDKVKFIDDNTMEITFLNSKEIKGIQNELIDILKNIFINRYGLIFEVRELYEEIKVIPNAVARPATIKADTKTEDDNVGKLNDMKKLQNEDSNQFVKRNGRKNALHINENPVFGKKSKIKAKYVSVPNILYEMGNIETSGVVYNYKIFTPKDKGYNFYSLFIYDGEGCIEIKFTGALEDADIFKLIFKIGTDLKVYGSSKYDNWSKGFVINPTCIETNGKREIIESGKVGDEDYYNTIITDREDNETEKRVELHLHTKSSTQDGVGEVKAYIDTATKFGMKAMAITDHGCVNALADAYEYMGDKKRPRKDLEFKIINGIEGYLVDDFENYYLNNKNEFSTRSYDLENEFVIYEFATTGVNKKNDCIIKIEAAKIKESRQIDSFQIFVKATKPITAVIRDNTGVREKDLENAVDLKTALQKLIEFANGAVFVTSSINKNWLLSDKLRENNLDDNVDVIDLTILSRLLLDKLKKSELIPIAKELKIKIDGITDRKKSEMKRVLTPSEKIRLQVPIFCLLVNILKNEKGINDLALLKDKLVINDEFIRRQPYYHIILLAKNDVGRVNLYKLVSDSSVKYMYSKKPRMPRSLIKKYREGLLIGSACIMGEFMDAVKNGTNDEELKNIASFYDYLEIQPTLNNSFLLNDDKENFKSIKDLENLNIKVVEIGDELNKPVVATCDCHYVNKEDKIYRSILRLGTTYKKSNFDAQGNLKKEVSEGLESSNDEELYFRTTREMLDEFSYLGIDKAMEVVVTNTNKINNMIENIIPLRLDKCPPRIEGSEDELKNVCYQNYKKLFGDNEIPEVKKRLDDEIGYIIDNGYSVMYIAAKKLIDYSRENGYPVGSRGSVGSSLAATLLGVSEVNPLRPHYICPNCQHVEYGTEETSKYDNDTGFDMPDKKCPNCNTIMIKDGVNIPFETFLGIPGDPKAQKEPDIDLNFCSLFQSSIHKKTVKMFGEKNTFKAGTVGTVAKKTAYGFVKKFSEYEKKDLTNEQVNYYVTQILNCKNNTGQHPGGMIVVPEGEEIYSFTPIQLAADKIGNDVTTHYDYHKIDKNLLKLDILGHDSPLVLKKLAAMTGVDYNKVPFYEEQVLKLFKDTSSLGITPNDISGTRLGCLTIPEFGTDFAMAMCEEAKPDTVADLIRIAGLAHGTDVWQNNVQDLIKNGDCTLKNAICCRDDIMIYLIGMGIDKGLSFNIMESVRKGKGLTSDWEEEMRNKGVPEWYIGCCKKIKYMFPKAHAAAYVSASLRIAYYKVHYPKEYYATYFSIKKDGIDYKLMMQDKEDITYHIAKIKKIINDKSKNKDFEKAIKNREQEEISKNVDKINDKEIEEEIDNENVEESNEENIIRKYETMSAKNLYDLYMVYRIVEEMKSRGIDFCPIDIYKAKRSDFQVIDGKIMPSFDSIPGVGTKDIAIDWDENVPKEEKSTAMKCEIEGRKGEYSSIENFSNRTGVNKTILEEMKALGFFEGMKEKEQTTIFDFI